MSWKCLQLLSGEESRVVESSRLLGHVTRRGEVLCHSWDVGRTLCAPVSPVVHRVSGRRPLFVPDVTPTPAGCRPRVSTLPDLLPGGVFPGASELTFLATGAPSPCPHHSPTQKIAIEGLLQASRGPRGRNTAGEDSVPELAECHPPFSAAPAMPTERVPTSQLPLPPLSHLFLAPQD